MTKYFRNWVAVYTDPWILNLSHLGGKANVPTFKWTSKCDPYKVLEISLYQLMDLNLPRQATSKGLIYLIKSVIVKFSRHLSRKQDRQNSFQLKY